MKHDSCLTDAGRASGRVGGSDLENSLGKWHVLTLTLASVISAVLLEGDNDLWRRTLFSAASPK